jgi:glyoxylase-like metal-dependent hydrolase (beta-lactamase superfamily II)
MSQAPSTSVPDTAAHPYPSAITPTIGWVGRGDWGGLPSLTSQGDCNIYLLKGAEFDVLIDCGQGSSLRRLEQNLRAVGSDPERVRETWLTHSRLDHFLRAASWTLRYPETVVRISRVALKYFAHRDYRLVSHAFFSPSLRFRLPKRLVALEAASVLCCPPFELAVEELPGHTPDQLGFRGRVDGMEVLLSGDAAIGDQNEIEGVIGWLDGYWHTSVTAYRQTLADLASRPPDLLLPGQGRPHFGPAADQSLRNCLRRIERLAAFPDLGYTVPFA